ncbi:MAG: MFS transporter [Desulfuromonas sp.]|mgnify:CR=1 FL=1|nr:MAG: MFS transporter [Desulfuromonas sp.]
MSQASTAIERGTKNYRHANLALFFAGFVTFSTLYTFQPLFPILVADFSISPATASLTLSVATFALAWMMPISGSFSDVYGRKTLMGIALLLTSLLALVSAATTTLPALLIVRLLQGAVLAGVPAVAMAYLNDEMSPRAIGAAMGLYIAGNACGGMTGRILTSFLVDILSWRETVAIIGLLALLLSILFWLLLPASRNFNSQPLNLKRLSSTLLQHLREPGLLCLFALAFLLMGGFVTVYNYATFYLLAPPWDLSQSQVALIFIAYAFGAGGSSVIGGLTERFGRPRLLLIALGIMAAGIILTLIDALPAIILGIIVFTIGFFAAHALASAWVGARTTTARAQASSLYLLAYYLGSSISGTGGGFVWSAAGWYGVVGLVLLMLGLAGAVIQVLTCLESAKSGTTCFAGRLLCRLSGKSQASLLAEAPLNKE